MYTYKERESNGYVDTDDAVRDRSGRNHSRLTWARRNWSVFSAIVGQSVPESQKPKAAWRTTERARGSAVGRAVLPSSVALDSRTDQCFCPVWDRAHEVWTGSSSSLRVEANLCHLFGLPSEIGDTCVKHVAQWLEYKFAGKGQFLSFSVHRPLEAEPLGLSLFPAAESPHGDSAWSE